MDSCEAAVRIVEAFLASGVANQLAGPSTGHGGEAVGKELASLYTHVSKAVIETERTGLGQLERAIEELDEAIRLDPQDAGAYHKRGIAYHQLGQYKQAIQELDEAIRLDPQESEKYRDRAVVHRALGELQKAVEDFGEAIRLGPQNAKAHAGRALVYTLLGDDEGGQRDFDRAVELGIEPTGLEGAIENLKNQR